MAEAFGIACHVLVNLDFRFGSRLCKNVVPLPLDLEPLGRGDFGGGFLGVCGFDGWREAQKRDLPF